MQKKNHKQLNDLHAVTIKIRLEKCNKIPSSVTIQGIDLGKTYQCMSKNSSTFCQTLIELLAPADWNRIGDIFRVIDKIFTEKFEIFGRNIC